MKSSVRAVLYSFIAVSLFLPVNYISASRPAAVINLGSGYPGGTNYNLNIHGKESFTDCPDDDLPDPGPSAENEVYEAAGEKSRTKDMTGLLMWTGWVYDIILDKNGDGIINIDDVPLTYDLLENGGNNDGVIDEEEFNDWQSDSAYVGLAAYYENEWILNIADLVVTDQAVSSDGIKLLKVRFYPVETTVYE